MAFYTNLNSLNDSGLGEVFSMTQLDEMCNYALQSKSRALKCMKIWKHNPIYHDNLDHHYSPTDIGYKFFICKNSMHFHSLKIFTSNFYAFNTTTKNIQLKKLRNLTIVSDCDNYNFRAADFLERCPNLSWIRISEAAIRFYMSNLIGMNSLKSLEIQHIVDPDNLLKDIIACKCTSLKRLHTPVDEFPPKWLNKYIMEECFKLEDLALDTRSSYLKSFITEDDLMVMPKFPSLKTLWIIGTGVCLKRLMTLMMNSPKLDTLVSNEVQNYDQLVKDVLTMRSKEGTNTTLTLEYRLDVIENAVVLDFE